MCKEPSEKAFKLPSFSVVMPCYNAENFVEEAIKSVLNFEYAGDVQIVIVDDGSTDNTWSRIQQIVQSEGKGKNICTVQHKVNKGVSAATDTACQYASNDWLVKADADDIQMPNRLEAYAQLIQKYPKACALELACQRITVDGIPYEFIPFSSAGKKLDEYFLDTPLQRYQGRMGIGEEPNFCDFGGTVAFKRELYHRWGNLVDEEDGPTVRFADDTVWGARYMLSGPVAGANIVSCLYRSRVTGNLEYRCMGSSYKDILQQEIESENGSLYKAEANRRAECACMKALDNPCLSDWDRGHILLYAQKYNQFAFYFYTRAEWWNWTIFKRIVWYMGNHHKLLPVHRRWCLNRILPLKVAVFFRWSIIKFRHLFVK